jgi:hypothetical protein
LPPTTRLLGADQVVLDGDGLLVISRVDMEGWEVRRHRHALIRFDGRTWRVARKVVGADSTIRYELVPWSPIEHELTGPEIDYGPAYVASRDQALIADRKRERTGVLIGFYAAFTGFLPARAKAHLEAAYGIDSVTSTFHSVILEYLIALGALALTAIGVATGEFSAGPFVVITALAAIDGVVRWDRIIGEERPPPGFFEWLFTRRGSPRR